MCGSITFDALMKMPLRQYLLLKKAIDIESIAARRTNIYDINRAFHDPSPLFRQLEKELMSLLHGSDEGNKIGNTISWKKDSDWKSQLKKFQV